MVFLAARSAAILVLTGDGYKLLYGLYFPEQVGFPWRIAPSVLLVVVDISPPSE
jgi:hypothetical protein